MRQYGHDALLCPTISCHRFECECKDHDQKEVYLPIGTECNRGTEVQQETMVPGPIRRQADIASPNVISWPPPHLEQQQL